MKTKMNLTLLALTFGSLLISANVAAGINDPATPDELSILHRSPSIFDLHDSTTNWGLTPEQYLQKFDTPDGKINLSEFKLGFSQTNEMLGYALSRFGSKTNPQNPNLQNIDLSFPNIYRIATTDITALPQAITDFNQPLTLGNLIYLLQAEDSPARQAIEACLHPHYDQDQTTINFSEQQVDQFISLLTADNSALSLDSNLNDENQGTILRALRKIVRSKTGFQGLMSLLIATTMNRETDLAFNPRITTINIKYDPKYSTTLYSNSRAEVILNQLTDDYGQFDHILFHELSHARHDALNMACNDLPLAYIYFSAAKDPELLKKLIPIDFSYYYPKMSTAEIKPNFENDSPRISLTQAGLGEFANQLPENEFTELNLLLSTINFNQVGRYDLWHNGDELPTMLGVCPLVYQDQLYVVEDRQNSAQYYRRSDQPAAEPFAKLKCAMCHNDTICGDIVANDLFAKKPANFADYRLAIPQLREIVDPQQKLPFVISKNGNTLEIPANVTEITKQDLDLLSAGLKFCIKKIVFADHSQIKQIPTDCFHDLKNLSQIDFGHDSQLTSIQKNAFGSRSRLSKISNLPTALKQIGEFGFRLTKQPQITFENNSSQLADLSSLSFVVVPNETLALHPDQLPSGLSYGVQACLTQDFRGLLKKDGSTLLVSPQVIALPTDLTTYQNALGSDFDFDQIKKIEFTGESSLSTLIGLNCFNQITEPIRIPAKIKDHDFNNIVNPISFAISGTNPTEKLLGQYYFEDQQLEEGWKQFLEDGWKQFNPEA